jgi:hypothetical protein
MLAKVMSCSAWKAPNGSCLLLSLAPTTAAVMTMATTVASQTKNSVVFNAPFVSVVWRRGWSRRAVPFVSPNWGGGAHGCLFSSGLGS